MYLVSDRYRTQRAISWWQNRQIDRLHQETELIRDHVLQDLFALRRSLSLVGGQPPAALIIEKTLEIADRCHENLAQLSDRLFSPYAVENLAVAIQELVERWNQLYPDSTFNYVAGPLSDPLQPNYQFLLIWLDELCRLLIKQPPYPVNLTIKLAQLGEQMQLEITMQSPGLELSRPVQLGYLSRVFRTIQPGRCDFNQGQGKWYFKVQWVSK